MRIGIISFYMNGSQWEHIEYLTILQIPAVEIQILINFCTTVHHLLHGEKFISKLYYFHKKIHYFFSDAGTHSKSRIFTILNSTF